MEQLLKTHENNSKRNLLTIKNNMSRLTQKFGSCKREMFVEIESDVQEIKAQLQTLFSLMEGNTGNEFNVKSTQVNYN